MKSLSLLMACACLGIVTIPSTAQAAPAEARPALLGSWAVDVSRIPVPPEYRPKSVTITFAEAGETKWSTQVDIIAPDNSERHLKAEYNRDGTAVNFGGDDPEADTGAITTPAPNVLVLALAKAGRPGSTRVYTVSPDGQTMIEEAVSWDDSGTPRIRTNYFARVKG